MIGAPEAAKAVVCAGGAAATIAEKGKKTKHTIHRLENLLPELRELLQASPELSDSIEVTTVSTRVQKAITVCGKMKSRFSFMLQQLLGPHDLASVEDLEQRLKQLIQRCRNKIEMKRQRQQEDNQQEIRLALDDMTLKLDRLTLKLNEVKEGVRDDHFEASMLYWRPAMESVTKWTEDIGTLAQAAEKTMTEEPAGHVASARIDRTWTQEEVRTRLKLALESNPYWLEYLIDFEPSSREDCRTKLIKWLEHLRKLQGNSARDDRKILQEIENVQFALRHLASGDHDLFNRQREGCASISTDKEHENMLPLLVFTIEESSIEWEDKPFAYGGFGHIIKGKWKAGTVCRQVAVKCRHVARFGTASEFERDILREANVMSTLLHPNILALEGVVRLDGPRGDGIALVLDFMDCKLARVGNFVQRQDGPNSLAPA